MFIAITGNSTFENFIQFLGLLVLFVFILGATYLTAKWVGAYQQGRTKNKNINVIETFRVSQTKYIQILKITDKYVAVAVSKDHVEFLTEIEEDKIIQSVEHTNNANFKDVFAQLLNKQSNEKKKKNN